MSTSIPEIRPNGHNVVAFPAPRQRQSMRPQAPKDAIDGLTWGLLLDQHSRGVLNPRVLEYLMAGVGIMPREEGSQ